MSRGRVFLVLLLLILIGVGTWYWVAPRKAWERFTVGVAFFSEGDLTATVDYEAVRANLRSDMMAAVRERVKGADGLGELGVGLVDAAVSEVGTAAGLAQLFTSIAMGMGRPDPSFRYRSLSRVDVELRQSPTRSGIMTMTRSGLTWRITRVWGDGFTPRSEERR